jgi:drug/metabolite transporter (DMT)-like permease
VSERRAHLAVVLAAACFASCFPVTKQALRDAGPYAVVALRFLGGGLLLAPWAARRPARSGDVGKAALCALVLLTGYVALTVGLQRTTSTAAAFITYLLVIIVPVLAAITSRRLPPAAVAAGAVLATSGLVLLAGGGFRFGGGELLVLGCAFAFAVHILLLGRFALGTDVLRFAALQLLRVGAGALVPALARGEVQSLGARSWMACGYLALAGLAGLVLQVAGQRVVGPSRTSLLLMVEPVLAAGGGYVIGERLRPVNLLGAFLILGGIAVSELPALRSPGRLEESGGDPYVHG